MSVSAMPSWVLCHIFISPFLWPVSEGVNSCIVGAIYVVYQEFDVLVQLLQHLKFSYMPTILLLYSAVVHQWWASAHVFITLGVWAASVFLSLWLFFLVYVHSAGILCSSVDDLFTRLLWLLAIGKPIRAHCLGTCSRIVNCGLSYTKGNCL